MKISTKEIAITITLFGILFLMLLAQTKTTRIGTIRKITKKENRITIQLKNSTTSLIIFGQPSLELKTHDNLKFRGNKETYKNQKQIIIERLSIAT